MDKSFELTADVEWLFLKQSDYDADKSRPMLSKDEYDDEGKEGQDELELCKPFRPQVDKYSSIDYFRRFEDIHREYLATYVGYVCYNVYRKAGANGAINYKQAHKPQVTLINSEDEVTEFADLVVDDPNLVWSKEDKEQAQMQLPYVMKRLHNLSLHSGVHMISMAGAFLRAQEALKRARIHGSTRKLRKNAVIEQGVYLISRNGHIGKRVEISSKNIHAEKMFDWIVEVNPDYPSYREDYNNFVHYCEVLNIDLLNDDLTKYDVDFLRKLDCAILTPDTQYNMSVFNALKENADNTTTKEFEGSIGNTLSLLNAYLSSDGAEINEIIATHTAAKRAKYFDAAGSILYQCMLRKGDTSFSTKKLHWVDGILYYDKDVALLNTNMFVKESYKMHYALVSELGYVVHVTDLMTLEMLTIDSAFENLKNKIMSTGERIQPFIHFSF